MTERRLASVHVCVTSRLCVSADRCEPGRQLTCSHRAQNSHRAGHVPSSETLVAGVDSSTQSVKVLLVRAEDGSVVDEASAPHPPGTEVHPAAWRDVLQRAGAGLLERASAIAVAGQQHGMVALDGTGEVLRPALLWNDLRSAPQVRKVVDRLGGRQPCADAIGSVPSASFTVTKLRWMAEHEPQHATRTASVLLPHDWLTWHLAGRRAEPTTDHGDASGTGYHSPARRAWLPELAAWALDRTEPPSLPRLVAPGAVAATTPTGQVLAAGTGDNMAAALGLAIEVGDVVVSIGTSGTACCVADAPSADPTGSVAGFCDATGRYLPLVCTVNASRILTVTASLLGVDLDELARLALAGPPGAGGLTLLPYLDGERTPGPTCGNRCAQWADLGDDARAARPRRRRGVALLAGRRRRRARRGAEAGAPDRRWCT